MEKTSRRVVGLFAGIGGIEVGLHRAGFESALLCDVWPAAQAVLRDRFPCVPVVGDVRKIDSLPDATIVAAGFPCQDLSQAGRTAGIKGHNSGLLRPLSVSRRLSGCASVRTSQVTGSRGRFSFTNAATAPSQPQNPS